jgi:predicted HTH transcriptional regulator
MSAREELFEHLKDVDEIVALVGTGEHLHLECKTWSANENEAQKGLAKALCGFANADGGVVVVGLSTKSTSDKYTPDLIDRIVPVPDVMGLRSRIESLVPELVEPPLISVKIAAVSEDQSTKTGFVVVDVPATRRSPVPFTQGLEILSTDQLRYLPDGVFPD